MSKTYTISNASYNQTESASDPLVLISYTINGIRGVVMVFWSGIQTAYLHNGTTALRQYLQAVLLNQSILATWIPAEPQVPVPQFVVGEDLPVPQLDRNAIGSDQFVTVQEVLDCSPWTNQALSVSSKPVNKTPAPSR